MKKEAKKDFKIQIPDNRNRPYVECITRSDTR